MGTSPDPVIAAHLAHVPVVPEFNLPSSIDAWVRQRRETQSTLWRLLGQLPPRPKRLQVTSHGQFEAEHFITEKLSIDNGAGETIPAVLLLPLQRRGRIPAILYCHWHGGEYGKGKVELFEAEHTPEPPGATLAKLGFAVLAIDAPGFGARQGKGPGGPAQKGEAGEAAASKFNLWIGRTLWGMLLRDDLLALDYLAARPEIDPRRLGVTGISMGATRAWWLMALDERLRAGVAVACLTRYQDLIAAGGLNRHGIYYYVPGLLNHFDTEAVVSLVAPRPLLVMNGDRDQGSPVSGIRQIEDKVRKVYALYGLPDAFDCQIHRGVGHEYTPNMWAAMLAWFENRLG